MPFQSPLAGAAAAGPGEFDVPGRPPRRRRVMRRASRGSRTRPPARLAGAGRHIGPGENQQPCGFPRFRRQRQAPGDAQAGMRRIGIADDDAQGAGFQRLLHGPQQVLRPLQRDGNETWAGQAQPLQPVAIKPPVLAFLSFEAAPQQWPPLLRIGEAAQRQGQGKAHGGRLIAIGHGRDIMQAGPHQPLRRQLPVDLGQAAGPGQVPSLHRLEPGRRLLDPRDMLSQRRHQRCNALVLTWRGSGRKLLPAPQIPCRFHTHDCNIQNVPILFSYMNRRVKMGKLSRSGMLHFFAGGFRRNPSKTAP